MKYGMLYSFEFELGTVADDLRGLLKASGANIVYDPMMFTYDVSLTQVIIVDSIPVDAADSAYAREYIKIVDVVLMLPLNRTLSKTVTGK